LIHGPKVGHHLIYENELFTFKVDWHPLSKLTQGAIKTEKG